MKHYVGHGHRPRSLPRGALAGFLFSLSQESDSMSSAGEEYISPTEAAPMLGVARGTMYTLIARGEIRSVTIAGRLLLVRAEVTHLAKTRAARRSARSGKR